MGNLASAIRAFYCHLFGDREDDMRSLTPQPLHAISKHPKTPKWNTRA